MDRGNAALVEQDLANDEVDAFDEQVKAAATEAVDGGRYLGCPNCRVATSFNVVLRAPEMAVECRRCFAVHCALDLIRLRPEKAPRRSDLSVLTKGEAAVLDLMAQGFEPQEISESLKYTLHTVRHYREQVYRKLRTSNFAKLFKMASGWVR